MENLYNDNRQRTKNQTPPLPPHDREAEQGVLGAIIHDNTALPRVLEAIGPEHFFLPAHRELFAAMTELDARSEPIDEITTVNLLRSRNKLDTVGGPVYVTELRDLTPAASNALAYAAIVREHADGRNRRAAVDALQAAEATGDAAAIRKARSAYAKATRKSKVRAEKPLDPAVIEDILVSAHRTDTGNAERLAHFAGADLRFCHAWNVWLAWDGRRWARCDAGQHRARVKEMLRACYKLAEGITDNDARKAYVAHVLKSEGAARIDAMLTLAQDLLAVAPGDLDQHPMLFNCRNGTLDLQNGELRAHQRGDFLTRFVEIDFDPEAKAPTWESFLARILGDSVGLVEFMQRAIGYSLCGVRNEKALFILHGESGDNGKSTLVEILRHLFGPYSRSTDFTTFISNPGDHGPRDDLAALFGARFVSAVEPDAGVKFSVSTIKSLTGMDTIACRHLYGRPFEYKPEFAIWLACNHLPRVPDTGDPTWRRMKTIPFNVRILAAEQDKQLGQKLCGELPGILAWAARGCLKWIEEGLYDAPEVRCATEAYRAENDQLARFLADESAITLADNASVRNPDLFAAFEAWCARLQEDVMVSRKRFPAELRRHGFLHQESRHVITWFGIVPVEWERGESRTPNF